MKQYLDIMQKILDEGIEKNDRTGVGTLSIFGVQTKFDLSTGKFPLLTTKKLHLKSIIYELLWLIKSDTNVKWLQEHGVRIWNEWADENGDLGPIYGEQWRRCPKYDGTTIDQLGNAIELIKNDPGSRRIIVDSWNVSYLDKMALTPCHCMYQFYVRGEYLDLQLIVRSNDVFLGQPFNIATYSLLDMMVAQVTGLKPGILTYVIGDCHLYKNHIEQAKLQLTREPRELPEMKINPGVKCIDDFVYEDFELVGYNPWPHIKAEVAV